MREFSLILSALFSIVTHASTPVATAARCVITEANGTFNSDVPPQVGDVLNVDFTSQWLGNNETNRIELDRSDSSKPYIYGYAGQVDPQGDEGARYAISAMTVHPYSHLSIAFTFSKNLDTAVFNHRYATDAKTAISTLKLTCQTM